MKCEEFEIPVLFWSVHLDPCEVCRCTLGYRRRRRQRPKDTVMNANSSIVGQVPAIGMRPSTKKARFTTFLHLERTSF